MPDDLGARLVRAGLVTRAQLARALADGPVQGGALAARLVDGGISEAALAGFFVAAGFGPVLGRAELEAAEPGAIERVPRRMACALLCLPVRPSPAGLVVAMADPTDPHATGELERLCGGPVLPTVARLGELRDALERLYPPAQRWDDDTAPVELTVKKRSSAPPAASEPVLLTAKRASRAEAIPEDARDGEVEDEESMVLPLVQKKIHTTPASGVQRGSAPQAAPRPPTPDRTAPSAPPRRTFARPSEVPSTPPVDEAVFSTTGRSEFTDAPARRKPVARPRSVPPGGPAGERREKLAQLKKATLTKVARPSDAAAGAPASAEPTAAAKPKPKPRPKPLPAGKKVRRRRIDEESARRPGAPAASGGGKPSADQRRGQTRVDAPSPVTSATPSVEPAPGPRARPSLAEPARPPAARVAAEPAAADVDELFEPLSAGAATRTERWASLDAPAVPPRVGDAGAGSAVAASPRRASGSRPPRPASEPPDGGSTLVAIRAARDRDEVISLACEGALTVARASVLLVLKKGVLNGHEGLGPGVSRDAIRNLWVPTSTPSMFKDVVDGGTAYRGPYGKAAADSLFRASIASRGGLVQLQPVMLGGRVIAVLCADDVAYGDVGARRIEAIADAVGEAFRRIIVAGKDG